MKELKPPFLFFTREDVLTERAQCEDEGLDLGPLAAEFERVLALDLENPANQDEIDALLDRTAALPRKAGCDLNEPSDWPGIAAALGPSAQLPALNLADAELRGRVIGAWLGRACGCLLGKPVEGWRAPQLESFLKESGQHPLAHYIRAGAPGALREKHKIDPAACFFENVRCMPEDDDMNYTVLALRLMQKRGADFTPLDAAEHWLEHLPILHTWTAERVAYRNFCRLIPPPASALFRNPYREWIGAQIRGDFFGYAAPGRPRRAAELAWRDASISHAKNGIYGEMWSAAMISAAFATADRAQIIEAGLAEIPSGSRLAAAIREVLTWRGEGIDCGAAMTRVHARWDESSRHHWCHTIPNAAVVAIALLWSEGDFGASICRAVEAGFDTDCNGATVGSILGAAAGANALPEAWTAPLADKLETGILGSDRLRFSALADETMEVIAKLRA